MNNVLPAATAMTWRPLSANEIGVAWVRPPRPARHTSFPVAASRAKTTPADAEKTYAVLQSIDYGDGGTTTKVAGLWQNVTDTVTDLPPVNIAVAIENPNGGRPLSNLPTMRLGTFYMKL